MKHYATIAHKNSLQIDETMQEPHIGDRGELIDLGNNSPRRCRRRRLRQGVSLRAGVVTTLALSVSVAAAFQSSLPGLCTDSPSLASKHLRRPGTLWTPLLSSTRRHVMTDPDALLEETLPYSDNRSAKIEKVYQMSAGDEFYPHSERGPTDSTNDSQGKGDDINKSALFQFKSLSSTGSRGRKRKKALPKVAPTPGTKLIEKSNSISRSSTMPGFAVTSAKEKAFRDGIRLVERQSGRKFVDTPEAKSQRKKANGQAMYVNSASVPESMIQFAEEIHLEDRISRQEEIELGQKTQAAVRLQNHYEVLQVKLKREPTQEEWCAAAGKINLEALRQAMEEGLEAKNKLVTSNLRLVQSVVNTYIRNGLSGRYNAGDLMQEGVVALIRAAEKFEPDRGWKFSTYAMYWVRSSVKKNQLYQSRTVNVPQRLHEHYKRLLKVEADLTVNLGRKPTRKELAGLSGMSELQVDRCISAVQQRCYSLDQEISNTKKPMTANSRRDTLIDIVDSNSDDGEYDKIERLMLREALIETLHRHLTPWEVELLLLRFGLKESPGRKLQGQPTIEEISRVMGVKPDKVRRTIKKSLEQLQSVGAEEWRSFHQQLL
jgi:RNA polymerase primary sigma factor